MEASAFSTALFATLCDDILCRRLDPSYRFGGIPVPPEVIDPREFAGYALLNSIFKKTECEVDASAEVNTLNAFMAANNACREWRLDLDCYPPSVGYSVNEARSLLSEWLEPESGTHCELSMASIEEAARFGPGASIGMKRKPTLYYFKVGDAPHTCTDDFIRSWYELSVRNNPLCECAEMARKARFGRAEVTVAGNLAFVPKSFSSLRTTVTEPSLNTYFQLGVGEVISRVLKMRVGIDLSTQSTINSCLAYKGSKDQSLSTIDLKQCSDYIAAGLVEFMFPRSAVQWFECLRTPFINTTCGPVMLWMESTMGNGFTFPMQTILLAAVVCGVYRTLGIKPVKSGDYRNFGVFGDDIIVVTEAYPLVCQCLTALGLTVNASKSFSSGPFRESCGADYFNGFQVRGVYCKNYTTLQDFYSVYNRLSIWSARTGVLLPSSLKFIMSVMTPKQRRNVVPPDEGVTGGIWMPYPPGLVDQHSWTYEVYVPRPDSFSFEPWWKHPMDAFPNRKSFTKWTKKLHELCDGSINEPAALKALLYGGIRNGTIRPRVDRVRYKRVARKTPRCGYTEQPLLQGFGAKELVRWQLLIEASMA